MPAAVACHPIAGDDKKVTGVSLGPHGLTWLVLAAIIAATGLVAARSFDRRGQPAVAYVVVGCATVAASPVSWTHHQLWTTLAAVLLIARGGPASRVAGWLVATVMTVDAGQVVRAVARAPTGLQIAIDDLRGVLAGAVCLTALAIVGRRGDLMGSRRGRLPTSSPEP
jgi:alpha-1,2-mannosyltransferase